MMPAIRLARTVPPTGPRRLPEANVWDVWLTRMFFGKPRSRTMTSDPRYRALFLGAGPQMQCGVGHFTRLLSETVEKLDPGSSTNLILTHYEGSLAEIWSAVGAAQSVVCNFPIVAWKRVISAPLLALAMAAPDQLSSGVVACRHHHHVLAAGAG
jgi:hypothetical protein